MQRLIIQKLGSLSRLLQLLAEGINQRNANFPPQECRPGAKRRKKHLAASHFQLFDVIRLTTVAKTNFKLSHSWPVVDRAKNNVSGFSFYFSVELWLLFIRFLRLFQFGEWKIALFFSATRMCLGMLNYERAYFSGQWISRSKSLHRSPFSPTPARFFFWGSIRRLRVEFRLNIEALLITHGAIVSMIGHLRNSFGMDDCPSKQRLLDMIIKLFWS